jgi:hypothetical protein
MNNIIGFAIQLGTLLPFILVAGAATGCLKKRYLGGALAFAVADFCLTVYLPEIPLLDFKGLSWNWVGKAGSLLLSAAVLWLRPDWRGSAGLTVKQRRGSLIPCLVTLALLLGTAIYGGRQNGHQPFQWETLLFQATMPSLSEELVFRSIMLYLLNAALGKMDNPTLRTMGWAVPVIVIWFGLGHSVYWAGNSLHVAWFLLFFTGGVGAALMFLRLVSGSILFPMIGHTLFNFVLTLILMLR